MLPYPADIHGYYWYRFEEGLTLEPVHVLWYSRHNGRARSPPGSQRSISGCLMLHSGTASVSDNARTN
jgi:hypothetical protein